MSHHGFIPPYLLQAAASQESRQFGDGACARTLALDAVLRGQRAAGPNLTAETGGWTVSSANNTTSLPGTPVRTQADPPSGDPAVDQAWDAVQASLAGLADHLGRNSFDNAGARVLATVHYSRDYANAFWNGTYLVFGDGDGVVFGPMTAPIDVGAHELGHAVTEHVADLTYQGQSGALNESMSDVFGSCVKQDSLGHNVGEADWLVGEGIFVAGINGVALRSMIAPGTAYDDPRLGRDPQPGHMDGYVVTRDDNGGVHYNSGIPNRAFALAATAVGGRSWTTAAIWFAALATVGPDCDFVTFARATVAVAGGHAAAVEQAWATVGVLGTGVASGPGSPAAGEARVVVRRSGGLLGQVASGELDLDSDDPRAPQVRTLIASLDTASLADSRPVPDGYHYTFDLGGDRSVTVAEQDLAPSLREIARMVLPEHCRPPAREG